VCRLDQDVAEQRDGEDFDPSSLARDYEVLAEMLPVFCVSGKAFQKMSGNFKEDDEVSGFPDVEDTEIPALKRHARDITKSMRAVALRTFFNDVNQYLAEVMMQVVISDQPLQMAEDVKSQERAFIKDASATFSTVFSPQLNARHQPN